MWIVMDFTSTKDCSWLWYNKYWNVEILVLLYLSMYLNFQRLDEILSTRNISKPRNREIKYARSQIPAEFEIIFFLIFDQSMT